MKKFFILLLVSACFLGGVVFAIDKVDINTATLAQLDTLVGIGPKYAQGIIDNRPYSAVDDLEKVKGIGPKTLQKIKDQGLACVNCGSTQAISNDQLPISNQIPITQTPNTTETATIYPSGVLINEIMPNPQGADETEEYIEILNSNSADVDLSGWQIKDTTGTISTYTIPVGTKITAGSFLVFKRPETKIMLNNDEDGLNLLTPDGKVVDSMTFSKAPLGQSYNKTSSAWIWSTSSTPGTKNIITAVQVASKNLPKTQKSDNNGSIKAEDLTASLNQSTPPAINPWPMFLIVLASTIILAIIVLFIKIKFLKTNVRT